jgi:hypothetical protein
MKAFLVGIRDTFKGFVSVPIYYWY